MKEKDARPTYEPPTARDLSSENVSSGASDMCRDGMSPIRDCTPGQNFEGPCGHGPHPDDDCFTGSNHNFPVCMSGGLALHNCHSGNGQAF